MCMECEKVKKENEELRRQMELMMKTIEQLNITLNRVIDAIL